MISVSTVDLLQYVMKLSCAGKMGETGVTRVNVRKDHS